MKLKLSSFALAALASFPVLGANEATVTLLPSEESPIIAKEIYGQFAEHLGTCIYGGLWVGENSPIPNTNGYRTDVLTFGGRRGVVHDGVLSVHVGLHTQRGGALHALPARAGLRRCGGLCAALS